MSRPCSNVFLFGDSFSDNGNLKQIAPELAISTDTNIGVATIQIRFNKKGINSDGKNWPFFVANKQRLDLIKAFGVKKLPFKRAQLLDSAISGASQLSNTFVLLNPQYTYPPGFGSFAQEIQNFTSLLANSNMKVKGKDVFIYHNVGGNDILQTALKIIFAEIPVDQQLAFINAERDAFVAATVKNLTDLYNLGMRRVFVHYANDYLFEHPGDRKVAAWYASVFGGSAQDALNFIQTNIADNFISAVVPAVKAFTDSKIDLEAVPLYQKDLLGNLRENAPLNGISVPFVEFPPDFTGEYNTQAGNGFPGNSAWPVDASEPVRNVVNLMFSDDVHLTQHTNKLYAEFPNQWISPLK